MLTTRRRFLESAGFLLAAAGGAAATIRFSLPVFGDDGKPLDFGELEPLAGQMQELDADRLQKLLIQKLQGGASLETLVAAAALANARTCGGEDYTGYHVMMALLPALQMASFMPKEERALPLLKVIHRNARRIQQLGGRTKEKMQQVDAESVASGASTESRLLKAERDGDLDAAQKIFARAVAQDPQAAFAALQPVVRDNIDVHQVVLSWRSWDMIRIVGREHAQTMLLQALRQCVNRESGRRRRGRMAPAIRSTLPAAMTRHGLATPSKRAAKDADDGQLDQLADAFFGGSREQSMEAAAKALADGVSAAVVGEAISLAGIRLLLHDRGRGREEPGKPVGSVHGASVGIHASDSANAWRHIAETVDGANAAATLLAAAWHTGGQARHVDRETPFHAKSRGAAQKVASERLLDEIDGCVSGGDQALAAALVERYGKVVGDSDALVRRLARFLVDQDGALHHEKFFHTAVEEYGRTRPAYRWLWLSGLARVAASGRGFPAPGVASARSMLRA